MQLRLPKGVTAKQALKAYPGPKRGNLTVAWLVRNILGK